MAVKKKRKESAAPKAFDIPEEMKRRGALLAGEVATWPGVVRKRMFGMTSLYRKGAIFAAIPETKAYFSATSVIFKLQIPNLRQQRLLKEDERINAGFGIGQKWYGYDLRRDEDLNGALEWLGEAFEAAGKKRSA